MAATEASGKLHDALAAVVQEVNLLKADVAALRTTLTDVRTDVVNLRTRYEAHTHGGITAGAASSAVRDVAQAADALASAAPAAATVNGLALNPQAGPKS